MYFTWATILLLKYNDVVPTYKMIRPVHEKTWRIMLKQVEINASHSYLMCMEVRKNLLLWCPDVIVIVIFKFSYAYNRLTRNSLGYYLKTSLLQVNHSGNAITASKCFKKTLLGCSTNHWISPVTRYLDRWSFVAPQIDPVLSATLDKSKSTILLCCTLKQLHDCQYIVDVPSVFVNASLYLFFLLLLLLRFPKTRSIYSSSSSIESSCSLNCARNSGNFFFNVKLLSGKFDNVWILFIFLR